MKNSVPHAAKDNAGSWESFLQLRAACAYTGGSMSYTPYVVSSKWVLVLLSRTSNRAKGLSRVFSALWKKGYRGTSHTFKMGGLIFAGDVARARRALKICFSFL